MIKVENKILKGDEVDKLSKLWDYTAEKTSPERATKLLDHLGLDNPYIITNKSLDECKSLVDKFLRAQSILKGN